MPGRVPTAEEVDGYFETCNNWGRWGPADEAGTLNHITPENRKAAAALVTEGVSVTCSRQITNEESPDVRDRPLHYMVSTGERYVADAPKSNELQFAREFFGLVFHGFHITHVDSLAHVFWEGKMYNGFPATEVTAFEGAKRGSVDVAANGITTRGVLLDIPRLKQVDWLEPGAAVFPEELEEAEAACGVRVGKGDVLFVRTGWLRSRNEIGAVSYTEPHPGLQAACIPWINDREIAMLGSDTINDVSPSGYPLPVPIHQVAIPRMGLWLIDNANLEELAAACETYRRWEFMLSIAPLRLARGTGSPVNPIATF